MEKEKKKDIPSPIRGLASHLKSGAGAILSGAGQISPIRKKGRSSLKESFVRLLSSQGMKVTTAESLTGGLLAGAITSVPGASSCFEGGFVTYSNGAKRRMLSVKKETLKKEGAVSIRTAREMAIGAANATGADVGIAVTGNAGPDAMEGKEVGLVYIGVFVDGQTMVETCHFHGDRQQIRMQTVHRALALAMQKVKESL